VQSGKEPLRAVRVDDRAEHCDTEHLAELPECVVHRRGHPGPRRRHARGLGLAFLPASVARAYDGPRIITVSEPEMRGRLALTWRAGAPVSPAARALIAHARAALPEPR
jgi:hypothetical protein